MLTGNSNSNNNNNTHNNSTGDDDSDDNTPKHKEIDRYNYLTVCFTSIQIVTGLEARKLAVYGRYLMYKLLTTQLLILIIREYVKPSLL